MTLFDWTYAWQILPDLLRASLNTVGITLIGFLIAIVLGLFLAIGTVAALIPIWRQAADRRAVLRDAPLAYGITAVLYLPWIPTLLFQADEVIR